MKTGKRIKTWKMHDSQRGVFSFELYKEMAKDENIFLLTSDLGYKVFDNHFEDFPQRTINCGAAEQAMLDMAVGLAYDGRIPVCYSITTFLIYRPFETIKQYISYEKLNVKLVGSGRDKDYEHDGISHWSEDVVLYLDRLANIIQYWPRDIKDVQMWTHEFLFNKVPSFMSLRR